MVVYYTPGAVEEPAAVIYWLELMRARVRYDALLPKQFRGCDAELTYRSDDLEAAPAVQAALSDLMRFNHTSEGRFIERSSAPLDGLSPNPRVSSRPSGVHDQEFGPTFWRAAEVQRRGHAGPEALGLGSGGHRQRAAIRARHAGMLSLSMRRR